MRADVPGYGEAHGYEGLLSEAGPGGFPSKEVFYDTETFRTRVSTDRLSGYGRTRRSSELKENGLERRGNIYWSGKSELLVCMYLRSF